MFVEMGADGFAARAGAELEATGDRLQKRNVETGQMMTPYMPPPLPHYSYPSIQPTISVILGGST